MEELEQPAPEPRPQPQSGMTKATAWLKRVPKSTWALVGLVVSTIIATFVLMAVDAETNTVGYTYGLHGVALSTVFMRKLRFSFWTIAVILAGFALYIVYFDYTNYNERNYDPKTQLKYVNYILENGAAPPDDHCFTCHHPPLYYGMAAGMHKVAGWTELAKPLRAVQLLSLLFTFIFVVFSVLTVKQFTDKPWAITLATALVVFWPYSVRNSIRMHNDVLLGACMAGAIYYLVCWFKDEHRRQLILSCVFSALAIFTKMNGAMMIGVMGLAILNKFYCSKEKLQFIKRVVPVLLVLAVVIGSFLLTRNARPKMTVGRSVLGTAYDIGTHLHMDNEPYNYLYFDLKQYLKEPFLVALVDDSETEFFSNHLLKSSLFATHSRIANPETAYALNARIAVFLNIILLLMLLYLLISALTLERDSFQRYFVLITSAFTFVAGVAVFRWAVPSPFHVDFRHIYPLLIPGSVGFVMAINKYRSQKSVMEHVGLFLALSFILGSCTFYLPKQELADRWLPPKPIEKTLSSMSRVMKPKTNWDHKRNTIIQGGEILNVKLPHGRTVNNLDISADWNDIYTVQFHARRGAILKSITVGHSRKIKKGLDRYKVRLKPAIKGVWRVTVKPKKGDGRYSVGHLKLY